MITFLQAVAKFEGFGASATNRPTRNHNPGDLEYGRFTIAHGAVNTDGRFAIFPDDATGFAAMAALFNSAYLNLTVTQAINKYAPSNENNVTAYVSYICRYTGLAPDTILTEEILK